MQTDILGHLIEIEHRAASLLLDAQTEADRRTAQAHIEAESAYKTQYEQLVSSIEQDYKKTIAVLDEEHQNEADAFKKNLDTYKQDKNAFNTLLDTLLFGE